MPFIWNDKTYWERVKKSSKYDRIYFYPPLILSFIGWFLYLSDKVVFINILLISFVTALSIFTFISLVLQLPNFKIPEYYHPYAQTIMRLIQFLISLIVTYFIWSTKIQPAL